MTPEEAYQLYRQYSEKFLRWTGPGKPDNYMPEKEDGLNVYEFHGSDTLAGFLTFVLENRK